MSSGKYPRSFSALSRRRATSAALVACSPTRAGAFPFLPRLNMPSLEHSRQPKRVSSSRTPIFGDAKTDSESTAMNCPLRHAPIAILSGHLARLHPDASADDVRRAQEAERDRERRERSARGAGLGLRGSAGSAGNGWPPQAWSGTCNGRIAGSSATSRRRPACERYSSGRRAAFGPKSTRPTAIGARSVRSSSQGTCGPATATDARGRSRSTT